jgi:signal transduction histidine kinase/PAS domain-containing protein/ActR/RegA family two-component response regulator
MQSPEALEPIGNGSPSPPSLSSPNTNPATKEPGSTTIALAIWLLFAAIVAAMVEGGWRDYPSLHTTLDTALALLAAVLAWLLRDIGRQIDHRLPRLLAITFGLTALLNLVHALVALEWSGIMTFVTQHAGSWRPATWPPSTHLLPIGMLAVFFLANTRHKSVLPFSLAMIATAALLLTLFQHVPRYTAPSMLGATRPWLLAAPLLWALVAAISFKRRATDRLMTPIALMAVTLIVANSAMLYSRAPHDTAAMIAHLGRVAGHLLMLLALLRMAAADMQARIHAEKVLAETNALLEARVKERTAELVRSNESMRRSEGRLRAFVSATTDVVYRMSPDWQEMRQLLGQDFVADTPAPDRDWLHKYIFKDDQAHVLATIHTAIQAKSTFELEHRVRLVDGSLGWAFSRAVPLLDEHGEITEWFGAASDITVRRQAEEKLQAQLARLSLLGEVTHAISARHDTPSIFQVVLRTLEKQLPADFSCAFLYDSIDKRLTVTRIGTASAALAVELALPEGSQVAIDQNGLTRCMEGQLVYESDISKSVFPFPARLARAGLRALVIAPLSVEEEVIGAIVVARRIPASLSSTDCEFLRQLSGHLSLATRQSQLYSDLQKAYQDLRQSQLAVMQQERLRVLGQLASGIAHDINNALSPAALYVQSLRERPSGLDEEARNRLTIIQRAIEDVGDTVARMRMFYRPQDAELRLAPVDLNVLVQQVAELTRARWKDIPQEHGVLIDLKSELADRLPAIMGAETEIRDALTNLIFNAADAMPEGGTLTLCSRTEQTAGVDGETAALVIIEVSDTGAGMTEAVRSHCIEPFFTTKGERGTGLGLAMVYGMAQRHGADLEIVSEVGRGTTMRLAFRMTTLDRAQPSHAGTRPARPLHLLLVDDDPVLLQSLKDVLMTDGHFVTAADGGRNGIDQFLAAQARGKPFALVITDLGMPNVDGRQVAAAIKTAAPATPVVMLTGWGQRMQDADDLPEFVDRALSKPPRLAELRTALAELTLHDTGGDVSSNAQPLM